MTPKLHFKALVTYTVTLLLCDRGASCVVTEHLLISQLSRLLSVDVINMCAFVTDSLWCCADICDIERMGHSIPGVG